MKLKNIIKPGIIIGGIGAFAAGEASAEGLQPWQIDISNPKQITVHVKRGDTLDSIAGDLDKRFGQNDDPNDLRKNLKWFTKEGYIIETNCGNPIRNPNLIKAGEDYSFTGAALKVIDPDYGKNNIPENSKKEDYTQDVVKKDIQVKTESKTKPLEAPNPVVRGNLTNQSELYKFKGFVLNGGIEYGIFEGTDSEFGEGVIIDLNAGYEMPEGLGLLIGGRTTEIDGNKYYAYKNSFFGFPYKSELDLGFLTMTELYAQITAGNKNFRVFGGYGIKSVGKVDAGLSYGWFEGEGGIEKDYGDDRFKGPFGGIELLIPFSEKFSAGIKARYGEYKTKAGLELKETSAGAVVKFRF